MKIGDSLTYTVTSTAPSKMGNSAKDDVLKIKVEHNGITGDNDLEINKWNVLFEQTDADPLPTTEAKSVFQNLYVYLDDGDGTWENNGEDTVVKTIANAAISLTSGIQEFSFSEAANVQISKATGSKTYFLVIEMKSDADENGDVDTFRITFDADSYSLNEDKTEDTSLSVEDSGETNTGDIPIPEFGEVFVPVFGVVGLFVVFRRKRRKYTENYITNK